MADRKSSRDARRIAFLDGMRGYFLIGMLITHLNQHAPLIHIPHHGDILGVWDAEGFVVVSGFLLASIIVRRGLQNDWSKLFALIRERLGKIYRHQIYAALPLTLAAMGAAAILGVVRQHTGPPLEELALVFVALQGPSHTDILPLYFGVFLLAPMFVLLLKRAGVWAAVAASLAIFLIGQLTYGDVLESWLERSFHIVVQMPYFDILSWQACFMMGFLLAWRLDAVKAALSRWRPWMSALALAACALAVTIVNLSAGPIDMWWHANLTMAGGWDYDPRQQFASTFFFDTFLLTMVGAILAMAPLPAFIGVFLDALMRFFTWTPLLALGRDSIRMYVLHVYLAFAFQSALRLHLIPETPPALYVAVFALIAVFIAAPWGLKRVDAFIASRNWLRFSPGH